MYVGQEATVRALYGRTDGFSIAKVWQGCLLSHCLIYTLSTLWKCLAGWVTSWNQDRWEKHQQPQICRWYHTNGRKQRGTKESLDKGERGGAVLRWWRNHFLPHKFIERSFERWANSTKQLLNAGRGHQAPKKATQTLQKEVGQNIKDKNRDKRFRDGELSWGRSLKEE